MLNKNIHFNSKYHNILTKDFLYKEYIINKKSTVQIAKNINCSNSTVGRGLKQNKIKIRTRSEVRKGMRIKTNNPNWKGGMPKCIDCGRKLSRYNAIRCQSCAAIHRWQNKEYKERQINLQRKNIYLLPNKLETKLKYLLNKILPNQYKFVGDGKSIVGGFIPDFVNKDNTKIIELFGCYWHKCKECGFGNGRPIDIGRLKEYHKAGYKTLIIWEHELKDIKKVTERTLEFDNE